MLCAAVEGAWERIKHSEGKKAQEIIGDVTDLLSALKADPAKFRAMDPSNGWGDYDGAIEFLEKLKEAVIEAPLSIVGTWR